MKREIMQAIGSDFSFGSSDKILEKIDESNRSAAALVIEEMIDDGVWCEQTDNGTIVVRFGFLLFKFRKETFTRNEDDCDTEYSSCDPEIVVMDDLWS